MTVFDLIVIAVLVISTGLAAVRGALLELATLIALGIAGLIALQIADPVLAAMGNEGSVIATALTYGVLIALLFVVLYVIIHVLLARFSLSTRGTQINRITGAIFGFARGYIVVGLGFLAYGYYLDEAHQHDSVRNAMTLPLARSGAEIFEQFIPESAHLEQDDPAPEDEGEDVAAKGYDRKDRAGLSEVITTVTTTQPQAEDNQPDETPGTPGAPGAPGSPTDPDQFDE